MPVVPHKFRDHQVNGQTEILILGTFNPDVPDGPDFFYGRPRNYLWELLPGSWNLPSLKNQAVTAKYNFMDQYKVDFVDLINAVEVPEGQQKNVSDTYIDNKVCQWYNVIGLIGSLRQLKAVYFTRSTFARIPCITSQIVAIREYCVLHTIRFDLLLTPARYINPAKQQQWINKIIHHI